MPERHVLVLPFPGQGHLNPLSCLADYLASSGLLVTLIHTTHTFSLLSRNRSSASSPTSNPRIEVVPDALPADETHKVTRELLHASFPLMHQGLEDLMQKLKLGQENRCPAPSCILADSALPWTREFAVKHALPRIEVWTASATVYSMGLQIPMLLERGYLPIQSGSEDTTINLVPGLAPFRLGDFPRSHATEDANSPALQLLCSVFLHAKEADRVLVNSFYDLESEVIDGLRAYQIPIDPVGPLLKSESNTRMSQTPSLLREDVACLDWLDAQDESSVVYVSFGSRFSPEVEVLQELALGLEASQERFLWVIRPDDRKGGSVDDLLPEGFQSRTEERGRIISWSPQLAVLAHPAVGAFLTHCGWNSTIESLYMGVPMLGLPQAAEQNLNLRSITDWKVGIAVDVHNGQDGKCDRGSVERAVRAMMRGEEGKKARRRAKEMREAARKAMETGSSKANLERLVADLKEGRLKAPC